MKAIIIGNAGSGKTWLARRLADGIDTHMARHRLGDL
jgi:nicotinamide riboside kinase